jgi:hypothetical protein
MSTGGSNKTTGVPRALPTILVMAGERVLCRQRAAHGGVGDRVTFDTVDGEDLSRFADESFDVLICSLGEDLVGMCGCGCECV